MGQTTGPDMADVPSVAAKSPVVSFGPGSLPHMSKNHNKPAWGFLQACSLPKSRKPTEKASQGQLCWLIMGEMTARGRRSNC